MRSCSFESRSRNVTVLGTLSESKSIVIPNGMPISSLRTYRRPIEPLISSILWEIFSSMSSLAAK